MDNFQYSVQLSDRDWAEFSATADECGLLQAGLASGDELLSSDIDQGDSSGSSPPGPPPLFTGQLASRGKGCQGYEVEDVATQQLVSRSQCEPVLALGTGQQSASTSTLSEVLPSLYSDGTFPNQCLSPAGSGTSRDKMQRLLQGPAPSPSGEPPRSSDSSGHNAAPQRPPDSPGAPLRSPGRKKRRGVGAKGGKCTGTPGPAAAQLDSPLLSEARPEEGLGTGTGKLVAKAPLDSAGAPEHSSRAPEHVARQGHGLDLSTPVPITKKGSDQIRMNPRAELDMESKSVQEVPPDTSTVKPDVDLSLPTSKPQTDMALITSVFKSQSDITLSTRASEPEMTLSTLAFKPQPNNGFSIAASEPSTTLSIPDSVPQVDQAGSPSASTPRHADLPAAGPGVEPELDSSMPVSVAAPCTALPHSASKAECEVSVSIPEMPSLPIAPQAEAAMVDTEVVMPSEEHKQKPGGVLSVGAFGSPLRETFPGPVQTPKRKKVRFSVAVPGYEESGTGRPAGLPSPTPSGTPAPRTAAGNRGGSAAWDAVAVGPRSPQPRILKHLPPPAPSASAGLEPRKSFAVTLPEAYEFFFCDPIEEEDESVEEDAAASQALGELQWPDSCELFFQDCGAQRSRRQAQPSPVPSPRAEAVAAAPPGDLVPISIPEAYEHFLGEEGFDDVLTPDTLLQLQTSELSREVEPETSSEPASATTELLGLTVRETGEFRGPLASFTFSQNDMCLVFVAFATWAVRTSDLHAPDAWKTVLLANIGTISAIRYFRHQARRGHSPTRSPNSSSSPSC
uniref:PGC-1 and ERR-induced regulator in muscle protein 1 isoform X1 n=1 Tax=Jaculus jaculus TaxID=51337 RepID=UPI001E1B3DC4|nr:PGC-1 and ERR-induced regulator in muscle protein 1 isoform X1 [Jaculus jaculus]XP_045004739.1 PGC-1 and ERR-induced regulator in muscle protein 1 isoform X1 [Jaculus jaculus]